MIKLRLYILGKNTSEVMLCLLRCVRSICIITDDVHFDHLIKVITASFLHSEVTMYLSLCNWQILCSEIFWDYKYPVSQHTFTHLFYNPSMILAYDYQMETSGTSCLCISLTSKLKLCLCVPERKDLGHRPVQERLRIWALISRLK